MKRFVFGVMTIVALALGLAGGTASGASGQGTPATEGPAAQEETPAAAPASDPLPTPDFARAYRHVFLAFAFAWVLIFAYAMFIDRRVARASEELDRLG